MASVNKSILIGRLGRDPESRTFGDGTPVCNFSIATSETWKDRNTGEKRERTDWHRIVAFRKLAEICGQYLSKGREVYIEGKMRTRSYEKDNVTHYVTEVHADKVQLLGNNSNSSGSSRHPDGYDAPYGGGIPPQQDGGKIDDIPF